MQKTLRIGVLAYNSDVRVALSLQLIQTWAAQHSFIDILWSEHIPVSVLDSVSRHTDQELKVSHVLISIGGDGTFLSAARIVTGLQTPILGVHTGKTGFLTDFPVERLAEALEEISTDRFEIRPRLMMDIDRHCGDFHEKDVVLNELLITPQTPQRMVNLTVHLNDRFLTDYWCDGLLISTPTGSTAYNLSAGGPILYPTTEALILTAVNPPSLSVRPLVVPATAKLRISEKEGHGCTLLLDGRIEKSMNAGEELHLSRSRWNTHFVHITEYGFVDALREKLGWCGNFRNTRGTDGC